MSLRQRTPHLFSMPRTDHHPPSLFFIAGWFISWRIPNKNGWWTGVPPFMESPKSEERWNLGFDEFDDSTAMDLRWFPRHPLVHLFFCLAGPAFSRHFRVFLGIQFWYKSRIWVRIWGGVQKNGAPLAEGHASEFLWGTDEDDADDDEPTDNDEGDPKPGRWVLNLHHCTCSWGYFSWTLFPISWDFCYDDEWYGFVVPKSHDAWLYISDHIPIFTS